MALVLCAAESVGAMQRAFDMTVEWAFDRYSFGRPLASYQALKHRFADMKAWLEGSHAIADAAATAVGAGAPDAEEQARAAKAFIGEYGSELMQECVQLHGGLGVTFEHDVHLFLRRHTLDRALFGTPAEHRRAIADILAREGGQCRMSEEQMEDLDAFRATGPDVDPSEPAPRRADDQDAAQRAHRRRGTGRRSLAIARSSGCCSTPDSPASASLVSTEARG